MSLAPPATELESDDRADAPSPILGATACVLAGAIGTWAALTASAAPTAHSWADLVWRGLLVGICAGAGWRGRRELLLLGGVVVCAAGGDHVATAAGFTTIGVVALSPPTGRRGSDPAGALGGTLVGVGLLHLGWPNGFGGSALLASAVVAVLLISKRRGVPRRLIAALVVVGGAGALLVGLAAWRLAGERTRLVQAVSAGDAALSAARTGDVDTALADFARVERLLGEVRLDGWAAMALRAVPVASQHLAAAHQLVDTASQLAGAARQTLVGADLDKVRPANGRIDPAVLQAVDVSLAGLGDALAVARADLRQLRSPWLVHPLAARIDSFDRRAARALEDTRRAERGLAVASQLLGVDRPRQYFLAVMTPAELRGAGGYVGNWGLVTTDAGHIELTSFARAKELQGKGGYRVSIDPLYDDRYARGWGLATWPQNLTASPDLSADAEVARQVLQQMGRGEIDGMVVIDPVGMAALLKLTGPIEIPGWSEPFTADNAARVLLFDQYQHASDPRRPELLSAVTHALFQRLVSGEIPGVADIVDALGPVVEQGHLQVISLLPATATFLRQNGLDHSLRPPTADGLGLITQNAAQSKLDWFLRRRLRYELVVDPVTGMASGTATVTLTNTAPKTGLPADYYSDTYNHLPLGLNVQAVSLYTTLSADTVELDGEQVEFGRAIEQGYQVFDRFVRVPAGGTSSVTFHLHGRVPVPAGRYDLSIGRQPTVAADQLEVIVNGRRVFDGVQDTRREVSVRLR